LVSKLTPPPLHLFSPVKFFETEILNSGLLRHLRATPAVLPSPCFALRAVKIRPSVFSVLSVFKFALSTARRAPDSVGLRPFLTGGNRGKAGGAVDCSPCYSFRVFRVFRGDPALGRELKRNLKPEGENPRILQEITELTEEFRSQKAMLPALGLMDSE
jgi:hypothetical protein